MDLGTGFILNTEVRRMENLTIGQLAKQANVNLETIRYYERRGLIPKPLRNESGYRQYSQDDVVRIKFFKRAQALGFSLKEIFELLSLRMEPKMSCADVKIRVDAKVAEIESKMVSLEQMRVTLLRLSKKCIGKGPVGKCPFLKELEAVKYTNES
jgi:MerR family mercuric resistance operon transcriptional regulator